MNPVYQDVGNDRSVDENATKIQALREMIQNAERTIHGAKAMLLQIEGKKKTGRPRKQSDDAEGGTVVQGAFDGQFMTGTDGKQYPVPANYASKSKLVEGDMLKLTITPDGSFIYKQIGPIERRHAIGIVAQDEHGNYQIISEGNAYRVLLASVTYFKLEPGDEVAVLIPQDGAARYAAVENVLQKGAVVAEEALLAAKGAINAGKERMNAWKETLSNDIPVEIPAPATKKTSAPEEAEIPDDTKDSPSSGDEEGMSKDDRSILEHWIRDMEEMERAEQEEKERAGAVQE